EPNSNMKISQKSNARFARASGFTLIELLLVLVILGILAAIVVPKFAGTGERARIQAAKTQINSFETALGVFEVDTGHYPTGKSGLMDLIVTPRGAQNWHGPYLDVPTAAVPVDPWGNPYVYEFPGKHPPKAYDITSAGPDGRIGTDDDISNWNGK